MKEGNAFSRWWSSLSRWRKYFAIYAWALATLLVAPPLLSDLLSYLNHNSFYDYGWLWLYYPYLIYAYAAFLLVGFFYARGYKDPDEA